MANQNLTRAYSYGRGFTGQAIQWRPGDVGDPTIPVAADSYIPGRSNTLKFPFDMLDEYVQTGTRFANRILERSHIKPEGNVQWFANPTMGGEYYEGFFGAKVAIVKTVAVTTGAITTAIGISTIPMPTAGVVVGAPIYVNTDASGNPTAQTEAVSVTGIGTGVVTVDGLTVNAAALTGIHVCVPAQTKYANSLLAAANLNMLPYLTIENNKGGTHSIQYGTSLVEKLDLAFAKDSIEITAGLFGQARPGILTATGAEPWADGVMGTYNPPAQDDLYAVRPFTSIDAHLVAVQDPTGSGTATLQAAIGIVDCKISIDNALDKETVFGQEAYAAWASDKAQCTIEYTEIDLAHRPAIWLELIRTSQATPFHARAIKNVGTDAAPILKGMAVYVPNMRYQTSDGDEKLGQVGRYMQKGKSQVAAGLPTDLAQVFVIS